MVRAACPHAAVPPSPAPTAVAPTAAVTISRDGNELVLRGHAIGGMALDGGGMALDGGGMALDGGALATVDVCPSQR